jgi:fructokinase
LDPELWLQQLLQSQEPARTNQRWVVVTAGAAEVRSSSAAGDFNVPVSPVKVVDTTAAGDAFVGALLYQLSALLEAGHSWSEVTTDTGLQQQIVRKAIVAGSLTCQQFGAFSALPTLSQITAHWTG